MHQHSFATALRTFSLGTPLHGSFFPMWAEETERQTSNKDSGCLIWWPPNVGRNAWYHLLPVLKESGWRPITLQILLSHRPDLAEGLSRDWALASSSHSLKKHEWNETWSDIVPSKLLKFLQVCCESCQETSHRFLGLSFPSFKFL